jgi:hypothetical protein
MIGMLWDVLMNELNLANMRYERSVAKRSGPQWVAKSPLMDLASQYRMIESPKKLDEQDC